MNDNVQSPNAPHSYYDAHCHLDFMANAEEVARDAALDGTALFANTVTPEGWVAARERFAEFPNVRVGFGMHPWWVGEWCAGGEGGAARTGGGRGEGGTGDLATSLASDLTALLENDQPRYIGEVGLDFSKRHIETRELQLAAFSAITRWAGTCGERVLSIHSVRAAREALDILETSGALATCTCIFHWYTGPSDQLKRAIDAGCLFSVNERMLATGKGREYVKAIPPARLLLETDAPPGQGVTYSYEALRTELERVAQGIARIKKWDTYPG